MGNYINRLWYVQNVFKDIKFEVSLYIILSIDFVQSLGVESLK